MIPVYDSSTRLWKGRHTPDCLSIFFLEKCLDAAQIGVIYNIASQRYIVYYTNMTGTVQSYVNKNSGQDYDRVVSVNMINNLNLA